MLVTLPYVDRFWATVCKTVRPMLSDRCPVCLSVCHVLSVTLVHCGQTVYIIQHLYSALKSCKGYGGAVWIKMKLGVQVHLGPGHIVLDGDPAPHPPKGHSRHPIFGPYLLRPHGCVQCPYYILYIISKKMALCS